MYTVKQYTAQDFELWNNFVSASKNGTFLLNRNFMEYHADRFTDFSLLIYDGQKLVALLPANSAGEVVHSHQGLTYGGLVLNAKARQETVVLMLRAVLQHLHESGIETLYIKTIPHIYHKLPSQEMDYALFLTKAILTRRDSLSVIENVKSVKIAANRMEGVKKGISNGFIVTESDDFESFWQQVLLPNLANKHGAQPVHTAKEMVLLKAHFPNNIKLYTVSHNGQIAAGTVIFETHTLAHAQYISGDENKGTTGSLDFLYHELVTKIYAHKKYFDFGTSNEQQGTKLNRGLAFWKESYGARTITQDFYSVPTANFSFLADVFI
jgi:hypothetical protein